MHTGTVDRYGRGHVRGMLCSNPTSHSRRPIGSLPDKAHRMLDVPPWTRRDTGQDRRRGGRSPNAAAAAAAAAVAALPPPSPLPPPPLRVTVARPTVYGDRMAEALQSANRSAGWRVRKKWPAGKQTQTQLMAVQGKVRRYLRGGEGRGWGEG